jgi:hypothetical protein
MPTYYNIVRGLDDLPNYGNGDAIQLLDDTTYFLAVNLDLKGKRLIGGNNTTIIGGSSENCTLTSTGLDSNVALFTTEYTTPIRHISFINVGTAIAINGNNRVVALDWTGVNFVNVPNIGTINTCENFIFSKGAFLNSRGLVFEGTHGTIGFDNSLFSGRAEAGNIIEVTETAIITRRLRFIYSSFVVISPEVGIRVRRNATIPTEGYILDTVNFSGGGIYLSGTLGVDNDALFVKCKGIVNTSVNGQMYMQGNATATTISNTTDFFKVAGTTIASADNQRYNHSNNRLTCKATIKRKYLISCSLTFESGANNVCEFGFYDSKLAAIRTPSRTKSTANTGGRAENIAFNCVVQHSEDDFIEIHAKNTTGANNITVTDMNVVITEFI